MLTLGSPPLSVTSIGEVTLIVSQIVENNTSERVKKYRYVLAHSGQRCYNSRQLFYF